MRGLGETFEEITTGTGRLRNGFKWQMQPGHRSFLKPKLTDDELVDIIEALMIKSPKEKVTKDAR